MNELATTQPLDLVVRPETFLPALTVEQAVARYNILVDFAKRVMREGRDYGVIPGTEKHSKDGTPSAQDNVLLKPGAEKLCTLFGLTPLFEHDSVIENFEQGMFHYSYQCILLRNARRRYDNGRAVILGEFAGSGIGSANSREKKYRRGARPCPDCGAAAVKRSGFPKNVPAAKRGWYCHDKSGGCGATFAPDDQRILEQQASLDSVESCDLVNTLQKMAQKRALIAATLIATNASDFFTQDVDEMQHAAEQPDEPDQPIWSGHEQPKRQPELVTMDQWRKIWALIKQNGLDLARVLAHYRISRPQELPATKVRDAHEKAAAGYPPWRAAAEPQREPGAEG